jgi:glycine cleavage system H protein
VSPVSGTVLSVNRTLEDTPESINQDPYGSWIVELEMSAWEEDRTLLVDGPVYAAEVERKAAEDERSE